ncbi:hypothetical protein [Mycolicibacterium tusciae]|uniref:hypothetical protein n=1 Tax=Mycolicibacterium tusciae TaxID=75922 RepID=UPI00024A3265|nr:hypothetical protein [Mycolicibacterium tusciae]
MASDIENIANALRALASHTTSQGREVGQAARESAKLVELAHAQGRTGLQVGSLVGQLQAAAKRAGAAAAAIEQVTAHGESFADHLAATRSGHESHRLRDASLAGFAFLTAANAPMPNMPTTDVPSGVGIHQVQQAGAAVDRADTDHDRWDAARQLSKRSSDDITEVSDQK